MTGGGRGIGASSALALARSGASVALSARSMDELERVAGACREAGVDAIAVSCDVTNASAIAKAHERIAGELGAPNVLVNNAGQARGIPFLKTTPEDMEHHWRLNLMGTYHCTRTALPAMLEAGWGRIINVASVAGKVGSPYTTAYSVSKHGVLGLTRCLAQEFATTGVTFNAVCPGYVDTPMTDENVRLIHERTGMPEADARKRLEAMSPQRRFMAPEEVAGMIAYLAAPEAQGVNGQALTLDGGGVQW